MAAASSSRRVFFFVFFPVSSKCSRSPVDITMTKTFPPASLTRAMSPPAPAVSSSAWGATTRSRCFAKNCFPNPSTMVLFPRSVDLFGFRMDQRLHGPQRGAGQDVEGARPPPRQHRVPAPDLLLRLVERRGRHDRPGPRQLAVEVGVAPRREREVVRLRERRHPGLAVGALV